MSRFSRAWNKLTRVERPISQPIMVPSITEGDMKAASVEIKKLMEREFGTTKAITVEPTHFKPITKEQIIDLEKMPLQPLHMAYPDIIANELMSKIKDGIDKSVQELREKGYTDEEILNKLSKQQEYYNKPTGDIRYNEPKSEPETSYEDAEDAIQANQIYREAKERILRAQNHQVRYGLDKYPEALNPDSWDILETIDHAMDEMVDQMHYMQMLRIKLEERLEDK